MILGIKTGMSWVFTGDMTPLKMTGVKTRHAHARARIHTHIYPHTHTHTQKYTIALASYIFLQPSKIYAGIRALGEIVYANFRGIFNISVYFVAGRATCTFNSTGYRNT